jgi:hypothetical protein
VKVTAPFPGLKLDLGGGWGLDGGRVPARPSATNGIPGLSALSLCLGSSGGDTCSEGRRARVGSPVGASVGALPMTSSISARTSASTAAGDTERARGSPGVVLGDRGRSRPNVGGSPVGRPTRRGPVGGCGGRSPTGTDAAALLSAATILRPSTQVTLPLTSRNTRAGMVVTPNLVINDWPRVPMDSR